MGGRAPKAPGQMCKPSVLIRASAKGDSHSSRASCCQNVSCNRPGQHVETRRTRASPLFGLAPGGVYRAAPVARDAVRSYRTLSPLPCHTEAQGGRFAFCGTFPGVAPAGRYPAPCFHGARTFLSPLAQAATIRPSDSASMGLNWRYVKRPGTTPSRQRKKALQDVCDFTKMAARKRTSS
jgi:hypothetical protein